MSMIGLGVDASPRHAAVPFRRHEFSVLSLKSSNLPGRESAGLRTGTRAGVLAHAVDLEHKFVHYF